MLETKSTFLMVIDVQGKLASLMYNKEAIFLNIQRMIRACQIFNIPIIWTEQVPEKMGDTISSISSLLLDSRSIPKKAFSCCGEPAIAQEVHKLNRNQVIITGIETHICVYQTVRDLIEDGFETEVIVDAVSSRTKENRELGLTRMKDIGAGWMSTEMALFELQKEAGSKQFKQIQNLIK